MSHAPGLGLDERKLSAQQLVLGPSRPLTGSSGRTVLQTLLAEGTGC